MQHPGMRAQLIWSEIVEFLRVEVSEQAFKNYIRGSVGSDIVDDNCLIVSVPHDLSKTRMESQYSNIIRTELSKHAADIERIIFTARNDDVDFGVDVIADSKQAKEALALTSSSEAQRAPNRSSDAPSTIIKLNPNYTFDSFVVGNSNRFAFSAASAVGDDPGVHYNPLFLYSPVGLGKTHLMHAIGRKILSTHPEWKVLYISSETFVNEMVESIQKRKTEEFRAKYRSIDVLLIDDIQFLSNKIQTQEEFFHTFNTLKELNKQIVVSSDCPPKDIELLSERIRSRFEAGLVADISLPDLEMRIAILRNKSAREQVEIPHDVIVYIADNISNNIRELEGALTRVCAVASMSGTELTVGMAENALRDIIKHPRQRMVTMEFIKKVICDEFKIKLSDLESTKRPRNIAHPRQIAMFLCRELTHESLPAVGQSFNRDHSTVIHACDKITSDIKRDNELKEQIKRLIDKISNQ